jgi:hypothetical protein
MVRHVITAVLKKTMESSSESPESLLQDSKGKRIMSFIGTLKMEDPKSKKIPSKQSTKVSGHFETISGGEKSSSIVIHGKIEEIPGVDWCLRCGDQVYPLEKLEPCPGQFYHERCFRCAECGTKLSLGTFCKNLQATQDPRIYCRSHQPKLDKVDNIRVD